MLIIAHGLVINQDFALSCISFVLDEFEKDREVTQSGLQMLATGFTNTELYRLKVELQKKQNEIVELQQALSDSHMYLYEEREQILRLTAENDELRLQVLPFTHVIYYLL